MVHHEPPVKTCVPPRAVMIPEGFCFPNAIEKESTLEIVGVHLP